jgi:hypothetical protein
MVSVDAQSLARLAAAAILWAAPVEYFCHRRGWGIRARLLGWAGGAVLIGGLLVLGTPFEEDCSILDATTCDELKKIYARMLPVVAGLSLVMWSVLYAAAVTVCRSIYRHVLGVTGS